MEFSILGALRIVRDEAELDLRAPKLRVLPVVGAPDAPVTYTCLDGEIRIALPPSKH